MKLKFIMSLFAFLACSWLGIAQLKINGLISDNKTNQALSGASIYITELKSGASSDQNGKFTITNIKPGTYLFEVSMIGYKTTIKHISILKDSSIEFQLSEASKEITEIVITGMTRLTELKKSPVIIKQVDKNSLNQNSASNLIDALKNVPGVNQISTGASISKPVIRGLGYNRVISLLNGIRQEGQQWGDEHGIEIDEYAIDKIEIIKGPGSLMYGSDGIAGVLNFISPKALPLGKIKTQFISNFQSNNRLFGNSIANAGNIKGIQWSSRFTSKFAGNYQNKWDGKVYNSGFREWDGNASIGIHKNWGHSIINFNSFNAKINLIEGERDSNGRFIYTNTQGTETTASDQDLRGYKIGYPYQYIKHNAVSINNFFNLQKGSIHLDVGIQNNQRKEFGDITRPNDIALYFYLNTMNWNARYNFAMYKGWESAFGIGGMQQRNSNKGLEYLIPDYRSSDMGAFVFTQKTMQKFTFSGGIRIDNRYINSNELFIDSLEMPVQQADSSSILKFSSLKNNYHNISGSIGLSYQYDRNSTIKFNLSRGFRAPNIAELSSNGKHEGSNRYEYGQAKLKSEISHQIDLAYFLNSDHISFELTPFANFISNYIYTTKLNNVNGEDSIPDPSDPTPAFQFTQGNAILYGGEIYLDFHPHPFDWLHIENSFSYVMGKQIKKPDSTLYLPFIPAPKYRGEVKATFNKINKCLSNGYVKMNIDYYFKQNNIFSAYHTETATPAYILFNIGMGATLASKGNKDFLHLSLNGDNLLNTTYQNHLSRLKYTATNMANGRTGVFNMGRNMSIKLIITI